MASCFPGKGIHSELTVINVVRIFACKLESSKKKILKERNRKPHENEMTKTLSGFHA